MKKKWVGRNKVAMKHEEEGKSRKWLTHYCSDHQILLVGEGDFSFSLCLANSFGSAANMVASSLDSYDDVTKKYKDAKSNLDALQKLGACLLHGVDATKMNSHSNLKLQRFDRVIFNFPHAGFHGKEDDLSMIEMHKDLVLGSFQNASCMLRDDGEVHVNHKTSAAFSNWNIEELAIQSSLTLTECPEFKKEDYPGYNNKRGDSYRCDEPFPLGECSTFKFILNPGALGKRKRGNHMASRQGRDLPLQETSVVGLRNGYTSCAGYSPYDTSLGPQRSLQPSQPWPAPTNPRHSPTDHVRKTNAVPLSLGARNEGYRVSRGSSNSLECTARRYIAEVPGRAMGVARNEWCQFSSGCSNCMGELLERPAESAGYSIGYARSDFERKIAFGRLRGPLSASIMFRGSCK